MPLPLDVAGDPVERVGRQLVAAMAFENLIDTAALPQAGVGELVWESGDGVFHCHAWRGPFGRIRIAPGSLRLMRRDGSAASPSLGELVGSVIAPGAMRGRLLSELEATAATVQHAPHQVRSDRRKLAFDALDCAIVEGHPYHPSFKARIGFSVEDNRTFGPEEGAAFQLVWLAVRRDNVQAAFPDDERAFIEDIAGAAGAEAIFDALDRDGLHRDAFAPMPVHPWQWRRYGPTLEETDAARYLGLFGDRFRASQSLRTLVNADRPGAPYVKLPLGVMNTSTVRSLDPWSVLASPVLCRWLDEAITADPMLQARYPLAILHEYGGATAARDGELCGQLGVMLRENINARMRPGESAIPLNALTLVEVDGRPFIEKWVKRHGVRGLAGRIVETVVLPLWHLMVVHGIATECHGQNLVLIHRDGWPVRLVARDFHDSLEYVSGFLVDRDPKADIIAADAEYADPTPDRFFWMERVTDLRWLTMDSLFIHMLSDVSLVFDRFYDLGEQDFWAMVALRLERYADDHGMHERLDRLGCGQAKIATEPLLRRKLGLWQGDDAFEVENAVAGSSGTRPLKEDASHDPYRRQAV